MDPAEVERLADKIAVVTGASSGIGFAIVKDLLLNGFQVVGLDKHIERIEDVKKLIPKNLHNKLSAFKCDVTNVESVNETFDEIIKKFGGVDILVNNAGCLKEGQLCDMKIEDIQEVLRTNVMGVIYCTRRAVKSMQERRYFGNIILINSTAGHKLMKSYSGSITDSNIYAPSKFALTAINEILRQEFLKMDTLIKITSISPGAVNTELVSPYVKKILKDKILQPEDISSAVLFVIFTPEEVQIHDMIIKPLGEKC